MSAWIQILPAVAVASLVGSLHCAGMCGPLMAFACGDGRAGQGLAAQTRGAWRPIVAYHGGRLLGYVSLGIAAGILGQAMNLGGGVLGLPRLATIAAGVLMIVFGLVALLRARGVKLLGRQSGGGVGKFLVWGHRLAKGLEPTPRAATIGLLTAAMPCGWLYAFVISAAGTGHWLMGGAVMAAFWLGSVPILAGLGFGARALGSRLGAQQPLITALVMVALGLWTVSGRLSMPDFNPAHTPAAVTQAQLNHIDHDALPCCRPDAD